MDKISLSYKTMYPKLYKRMLRVTGDGQLAQEIINEAFMAVMEHKVWWLKQSDAVRQKYVIDRCDAICQNHLEKTKGAGYMPYDDDIRQGLAEEQNSLEEKTLIRENLLTYMGRLPKEDYRIMYMKYFKDMSVTEISDKLGISEYTVYKRLSRARETLRKMMDIRS